MRLWILLKGPLSNNVFICVDPMSVRAVIVGGSYVVSLGSNHVAGFIVALFKSTNSCRY